MNSRKSVLYTFGDDSLKKEGLKKKFVRVDEGAQLYSMGVHTFRRIASEAGALYKVGKLVLINTELVDDYLDIFKEQL